MSVNDIPRCPRCLSRWHTDCFDTGTPGPIIGIIAWGVCALLALTLLLAAIIA